MNKVKAAAIVLAVILSCLAGFLLIAYYATPDNNSKNISNSEVFNFENQMLANTAPVDFNESTLTATNMAEYFTADESTISTNETTFNTTNSFSENMAETMEEIYSNAVVTATTITVTETVTTTTVTEVSYTEAEPVQQTTVATIVVNVTEPAETFVTEPFSVPDEWFYVEQPVYYEEPVTNEYTYVSGTSYVSESDYILLCNAVAHEAGSDWIDIYSKANVVEVIMNRVNSPLFPDTIYGVVSQPYQFEGSEFYINMPYYSYEVTDSVIAAVDLYFNEPYSFMDGYFYFYGDGYQNYFS
ncbi:MAG: cell wall hydrolase [Ruminococcus sp.]|nr:cell wall hydrolase [Ruminococcus sp.]